MKRNRGKYLGNRKKRKSLYIRIKNSWRSCIKIFGPMIKIQCCWESCFERHPKAGVAEIIMDFTKRNDIIRYGVIKHGS